MLHDGERQVAPSLDGIRRDHTARYRWAAETLPPGSDVIDVACGVGYGAYILAEAGHTVTAIDRDPEAIAYAREHYAHERAHYRVADVMAIEGITSGAFDAAISFETIEHLADPRPFLAELRRVAPILLASVPNEAAFPHQGRIAFHHRHYRPHEFKALLEEAGFAIDEWHGQAGPESDVEPGRMGRTIIAAAHRAEAVASNVTPLPAPAPAVAAPAAPQHVSIVGLGPSDAAYLDTVKRLGGRHAYCDETWAINAHGAVLDCDAVWHMDDVRVQEIRAAARPDSNIAKMLEWLRHHPGPIYTSRSHPDYPGLVEFPLQEVLNRLGYDYFNSTAAYAVAYAIFIGVKKLSLWGFDFTYPNAHDAEKGRGCVEYWIGVAMSKGIQIVIPKTSTLLDAYVPQAKRLYGYDTVDVAIEEQPDQTVKVRFSERATLPTAAEIEDAYDHTKHPAADLATVA